jgi:hypothetical protein
MNRAMLLVATIATLLAVVPSARATSCVPMADHFVLACDQAGCRPLFRASETFAYGTCGRAMTISPFPEWAKEIIVETVRGSTSQPTQPLVTSVELMQRYHLPTNERELRESLKLRWSEPRVTQHAEGPETVRTWYVQRCAADASEIRTRIAKHILLASSLAVALIGSFVWLLVGLSRRDWSARRGMLGRALAVKLSLLGLGVGLIFVFPLVPAPLLLLAPLALVFALLDLGVYFLIWLRRRRSSASERAAQPGVEPDGPSARGLTP